MAQMWSMLIHQQMMKSVAVLWCIWRSQTEFPGWIDSTTLTFSRDLTCITGTRELTRNTKLNHGFQLEITLPLVFDI